jgi:AraC-like DNA-binding protein/quercetin dioxygenase-like cupin family protein
MDTVFETIRVPEGAAAWVYLFSENNITTVPAHWHFSVELTFICRGQALYTVNGRRTSIGQGGLILINSGDVHDCNINPDSCEGLTIMFPNKYFASFAKSKDAVLFKLDSRSAGFDKLTRICGELYRFFAQRGEDPYAQIRINSLVNEIAWHLLTSFRWNAFAPLSIVSEKYRKRCNDITDYVDRYFDEPITMKTLMNKFHLSREHLARIFREYMGTTFKKYLVRVRTYHAYKLLTTSDLTVIQIAVDCGFSDSRAFISAFCKAYSITPGKYRREYYQDVHHTFRCCP